uniref:WD40 repeat domain-containing protein n=1 Tax=candidate division WOR-3 bacterium TaxID=2052148 RepID=A0A7V3RGY1_UNCW3
MRKMIIVITFAVCFIWAEVKVEKVLETTSTEEYNQWIVKNKKCLPGLRPILVDVEPQSIRGIEDTVNAEHKIYYYSDSGRLLKREIIKYPHTYFYIPLTLDRIIVTKSYGYKSGTKEEYTVKNSQGETIFEPQSFVSYIGMGLYIESHISEGDIPDGIDARVFDHNYNEIGVIKDLAGVDLSQLRIAYDERYAVFRGMVGSRRPVICINKKGETVWRKEFEPSVSELFISADGTRIGIHHGNHITILNEDGSLISTFTPFGQIRAFKCGISPNGNYLIASNFSRPLKLSFYNVATGTMMWCDDSTLAKNRDVAKSIHIDVKQRIIVLSESNNLYIFDKNGKLEYKQNLNLGTEMHRVPGERKNGIVWSKVVEVPARDWFAEVSGEYLIITLGRGGINDCYRTVRRRIVYRIVETK